MFFRMPPALPSEYKKRRIDMQAYINKFLRWFLRKTKRTCEHCGALDGEIFKLVDDSKMPTKEQEKSAMAFYQQLRKQSFRVQTIYQQELKKLCL